MEIKGVRVSEYYKLDRNQASLDFVDVRIDTDIPLFIDPTSLHLFDSEWGRECVSLIQNYFSLILQLICADDLRAKKLLSVLGEPNETRLGFSRNKPQGHGMGRDLAEKMWFALKNSTAAKIGIIQELEDTVLLIDGIGSDIISDIVTNIIRGQLIKYTQRMCEYYNIPMELGIASGRVWNSILQEWSQSFEALPVVNDRPLLLVPKTIVRHNITYDAASYYNVYILKYLGEQEAARGIVRILKNNRTRPLTKNELRDKFGKAGKEQNRTYTPIFPEALSEYREEKRAHPRKPLTQTNIAESLQAPSPSWDELISRLGVLEAGSSMAHQYEFLMKDILTALFYPWLSNPIAQNQLHDGRKRIDITFDNVANEGFFHWLRENYFAPLIMVECKNYNQDPANPELDQMSGRFGVRRGHFGLIVCRKFDNKELFIQRCKDVSSDGRGYIIALDDDDVRSLILAAKASDKSERLTLLRERFQDLI